MIIGGGRNLTRGRPVRLLPVLTVAEVGVVGVRNDSAVGVVHESVLSTEVESVPAESGGVMGRESVKTGDRGKDGDKHESECARAVTGVGSERCWKTGVWLGVSRGGTCLVFCNGASRNEIESIGA